MADPADVKLVAEARNIFPETAELLIDRGLITSQEIASLRASSQAQPGRGILGNIGEFLTSGTDVLPGEGEFNVNLPLLGAAGTLITGGLGGFGGLLNLLRTGGAAALPAAAIGGAQRAAQGAVSGVRAAVQQPGTVLPALAGGVGRVATAPLRAPGAIGVGVAGAGLAGGLALSERTGEDFERNQSTALALRESIARDVAQASGSPASREFGLLSALRIQQRASSLARSQAERAAGGEADGRVSRFQLAPGVGRVDEQGLPLDTTDVKPSAFENLFGDLGELGGVQQFEVDTPGGKFVVLMDATGNVIKTISLADLERQRLADQFKEIQSQQATQFQRERGAREQQELESLISLRQAQTQAAQLPGILQLLQALSEPGTALPLLAGASRGAGLETIQADPLLNLFQSLGLGSALGDIQTPGISGGLSSLFGLEAGAEIPLGERALTTAPTTGFLGRLSSSDRAEFDALLGIFGQNPEDVESLAVQLAPPGGTRGVRGSISGIR